MTFFFHVTIENKDDDLIDDELTDCYVDEAFSTIKSPPVALTSQSRTRRRSPVRKVRQTRHSRLDVSSWKEVSAEDSPVRKQKGNIHKGRGYRERKTQNEVHLNIGSTPDVSKLNNSAHQALIGFIFVAS